MCALAFDCYVLSRASFGICLAEITHTLGFNNALLGAETVMKMLAVCLPNIERIAQRQEPCRYSEAYGFRTTLGSCEN